MAEAIIGSSVQFLLEKLVSVASDRIGLVFGFNDDLQALQTYAKDIQAVLADAEARQSQNPLVRRWLQKVQGAAVEAYYILDELVYESLRRKVKSRNQKAKVCLFFSLSKHDISFRWRMSSKVRNINDKLKTFNDEAVEMGLFRMTISQLPDVAASTYQVAMSRQTDSLPVPFVAGRDDEILHVVEVLIGSFDQRVSVLPIVGMGGLGKTTLAKSVYHDSQTTTHFAKKGWICVSRKFEVIEVFRGILESLKGVKVDICARDAIVQQLQKEIGGDRVLFVLDDVWNEDPKLWDDFYTSLLALNLGSGSCCLLTTRLQTTAELVSTLNPFMLGKLSDDDCWSILTQRATRGGDIPDELEVHKNKILRKCKGVPLAAKAIGGLLSLQRKHDWLSIVENKVLKISDDVGGEIMPILRLSFDHLPSTSIKKCFAYCSMYDKDTQIDGETLVQLWMAEGFLHDDAERGTLMEEMGYNYLRILVQSSLLEERTSNSLQMHDLVHDLAEYVIDRQEFNGENEDLYIRHLTRYMSFWNGRSPLVRIANDGISYEMLLKFKCLHILNMSGEGLKSLIPSVSKLKHLRHLSILSSEIETLPESLCRLYHLQTLRLDRFDDLKGLPLGFSKLINLRHLELDPLDSKFQMPPNMRLLTCLQTLKFFNVGKENGCGIEELGSMRNLKGSIMIRNLELVRGREGARSANFLGKQNLKCLRLSWDSMERDGIADCDEHILEGLEPHSNLQELTIENFMGVKFPPWFVLSLALVKLTFVDCKSCTELPELGHLPYLKELEINGLENVVCIGDDFYNNGHYKQGNVFPALKYLKLCRMTNLVDWKEFKTLNSIIAFPKLEQLDISDCCQLVNAPSHYPSLVEFNVSGNLQVRVAKNILEKNANLLKKIAFRSVGCLASLFEVITNPVTSLERFVISKCNSLTEIPSSMVECCASLKVLTVESCQNLMSFPLDFQQTPSLKYVTLSGCPKLFTADSISPRGGFNHLWNATIGPISDDVAQLFDSSGLQASPSLIYLNLSGFPHSLFLPPQIQHYTSLTYLIIDNFGSMEALPDWLGNVTSLRKLYLMGCPKLLYLPSAHAMARLTNLELLTIGGCPLLAESWARRNEPHSQWSKISHLPKLEVEIF